MKKPKILKYKKSPSLAVKREWIDLFWGQKVSIKSIADDYGYPYLTVYRVVTRMDERRKERSDKGKPKSGPVLELPDFDALSLEGESIETKLEMFIDALITAVQRAKKINAAKAISLVNQLTNAHRRLRSVQFSNLAKDLDVKVVARIIRKYEPDATEMRVIQVFKEVLAELKAEKAKG